MLRSFALALAIAFLAAGSTQGQQEHQYVPRETSSGGPELLAIVVSAGYCTDSQMSAYRDAVEQMKLLLRDQARARGQNFSAVGVATDWDTGAGLQHLSRLGKFDQVIAGGGWTNFATARVLKLTRRGRPTTPQVFVVERVVAQRDDQSEIKRERLVYSVAGVDAIVRWVESGAPVDR